jgi:ribosome biogenesis GTPase
LTSFVKRGDTLVFVGSSGVGKSTLVNHLLGNSVQRTGDTRERDERGMHVTSHRELFLLPDGGLLMDTPGMRELQVWAFDAVEMRAFDDVELLSHDCRFRDCTHRDEPGCAVLAAVAQRNLAPDRLASYHKLRLELEGQKQRQSQLEAASVKRRWREASRAVRRYRKP